jgi:hypothetical protein
MPKRWMKSWVSPFKTAAIFIILIEAGRERAVIIYVLNLLQGSQRTQGLLSIFSALSAFSAVNNQFLTLWSGSNGVRSKGSNGVRSIHLTINKYKICFIFNKIIVKCVDLTPIT